ncbi:acyl-CoA reductase [Actinomadura sp. 7K507]|uniref:acyl-CoA reductase n=1 Tax=Actinomadura sp. 7K507 TaxID=2530365 RepID=UPI0014049E28|nr:acyl-CoA reductase [Actinomadura sp. 7K507]
MGTEPLTAYSPSGRKVVMWRTAADGPADAAQVVVISPGMARQMRHLGPVALYLARNGAVVYGYDQLGHPGLGEGDPERFTLGAACEGLETVLDFVTSAEDVARVSLVAASISARVAFRVAATGPAVLDRIVGVVNLRRSAREVFGPDYAAMAESDLPDRLRFEQWEIDPRPLWREQRAEDWASLGAAVAGLREVTVLVVNFVAARDGWVAPDDAQRAFAEGAAGPRLIVEIPYAEHDLGRNYLVAALEEYESLLPPSVRDFDATTRVTMTRLEERFLGAQVRGGDAWTVVVRPPGLPMAYPLRRTIFVHPVGDLVEAAKFLGPEVQTVAAAPWSLLGRVRDRFALAGVSRFTELGLSNIFRVGGSHDGIYPLSRLVRFVSMEEPKSTFGKGGTVALDQTELLRRGRPPTSPSRRQQDGPGRAAGGADGSARRGAAGSAGVGRRVEPATRGPGADRFDLLEITLRCQRRLNAILPEEEGYDIVTVGDALNAMSRAVVRPP